MIRRLSIRTSTRSSGGSFRWRNRIAECLPVPCWARQTGGMANAEWRGRAETEGTGSRGNGETGTRRRSDKGTRRIGERVTR